MLKSIAVQDAALGIYVHDLGMSWWEHDFLRPQFLIDTQELLDKVLALSGANIVIDLSKGADVGQAAPAVASIAQALVEGTRFEDPLSLSPASASARRVAVPLERELGVAIKLIKHARAAVQANMQQCRTGSIGSIDEIKDVAQGMVESIERNPGALMSLVGLKTKDDYTFMHSVAVGAFMIALGKQLALSETQLREAGTAGLMHDVGKSFIDDAILNKPSFLTEAEFKIMREHPQMGYEVLRRSGYPDSPALDVVLHHHERLDGRGYPHQLPAEKISQLARMGAVTDVYDAVTSDRVYHKAIVPTAALRMLLADAGSHFDLDVSRAFIKTIGIYPNGTMVKLRSGLLAVVMEQCPDHPLQPRVRVFYSTNSNMPVALSELELSKHKDSIIGVEDPQLWGFNLSRYTGYELN